MNGTRIRLEMGTLAIVIAFTVIVGWRWYVALLSWGFAEVAFAVRDMWRGEW